MNQGVKILHDPIRNKSTAFTEVERDALKLRGLLPPRVHSLAEQEMRVLGAIRSKVSDLERYLYLVALQDRNETLFYRILINHIEEMMPLVYTPTVGLACQEFGHIYRIPRGLYITPSDRGNIREVLSNWPHQDVRVIVVTDGERILGLGDLGANGMGIPIGKLSLYTACAGIQPTQCLPVMLDVGTENESLLDDPLYNGLERKRLRGQAYDALVEEFILTAQDMFPHVMIQLEDFGNKNAFKLLQCYRNHVCLFDDDIQGTGAVALAGILASLRVTKSTLSEQKVLFLGAGEAGIGIADTISSAMIDEGMSPEDARKHCWFVDSKGLVVRNREGLSDSKLPYAHDHTTISTLIDAIKTIKPTVIIGVSGQTGAFNQESIAMMSALNKRPIILALSNPTSKAECTAEQAYAWSNGMALFASGSPFNPVEIGNQTFVPGQGNNAYIFPGVGLGVVTSEAKQVTDEMFLVAARCLAEQVTENDLKVGRLYPPLSEIRTVSALIARDVAKVAYKEKLTDKMEPKDILADIQAQMFQPVYPHYA